MLPGEARLRVRRDFERVYRRGRWWAHPLLALHVLPAERGLRVGISVGKKVGKAVRRNAVRRRLRELLRARLTAWKTGLDAVLVARGAAAAAEFAELGAALDELARRARLPREPEQPVGTAYRLEGRGGPPGPPRKRPGK